MAEDAAESWGVERLPITYCTGRSAMLTKKPVALLTFTLTSCLFTFNHPAARQVGSAQAKKVFGILKASCEECHGDHGEDKDKFWLNYQEMIKDGTVVPGKPDTSLVYTIVKSGKMPQGGSQLSATQIADIKKWISEGAPDWNPNKEKPTGDTPKP